MAAAVPPAAAEPQPGQAARMTTGKASVVDGNTLEIARRAIRLHGLRAPGPDAVCTPGGRRWACGTNASFALARFVGRHWVYCQARATDSCGRPLAVCTLAGADGPEVNAWMVREGWALADPATAEATGYAALEAAARAGARGLWAGGFVPPAAWRAEAAAGPSACR